MDLYTFIQLIIVTITATSAMTMFSYAISNQFQELYKEPVLLTYMLAKLKIKISKKAQATLAWILHYLIGFLFVWGYYMLWVRAILPVTIVVGLVLGTISGIIGIMGWMMMFKLSNHKPKIDFKGYYLQLLFAHIIFGVVATAMYSFSLILLIVTKSYVTV